MHRSLTVREVLYYNAVLRLPPPSDPKVYGKIVKQVWMTYARILKAHSHSMSGGSI
jgi:hypothetical protein